MVEKRNVLIDDSLKECFGHHLAIKPRSSSFTFKPVDGYYTCSCKSGIPRAQGKRARGGELEFNAWLPFLVGVQAQGVCRCKLADGVSDRGPGMRWRRILVFSVLVHT